MTITTPTEGRAMRADARRNRTRILEAARAAFDADGLAAQMEDVARRAGVGVGTLYRHFPTKEALVEALVADRMTQIAGELRRAVGEEPDAWSALVRTLRFGVELQAGDRALAQVLGSQPPERWEAAKDAAGLDPLTAELIARAQAEGALRPDLRVDDIPVLMCGMSRVVEMRVATCGRPSGWERYFALLLDGLRARDGADPLPD